MVLGEVKGEADSKQLEVAGRFRALWNLLYINEGPLARGWIVNLTVGQQFHYLTQQLSWSEILWR